MGLGWLQICPGEISWILRLLWDQNSREEGDHPKVELSACPTLEVSIMPIDHSELVRTAGKGGRRRKGRAKESSASVENSSQQLEKAQFAIAELYQENRELWGQFTEKTQRIPSLQGRAGSTIWM
jgi:hypothetical protein